MKRILLTLGLAAVCAVSIGSSTALAASCNVSNVSQVTLNQGTAASSFNATCSTDFTITTQLEYKSGGTWHTAYTANIQNPATKLLEFWPFNDACNNNGSGDAYSGGSQNLYRVFYDGSACGGLSRAYSTNPKPTYTASGQPLGNLCNWQWRLHVEASTPNVSDIGNSTATSGIC